MGFRFWRRIKIAPGVFFNFSRSGASVSIGPRGLKLTIGPKGTRFTVGVPGTGFFYTTMLSTRRSGRTRQGSDASPALPKVRAQDRLTLSFFKRLITPNDEEALVDGLRELVCGDEEKALEHLRKAVHLADGACLAGLVCLKRNQLEEAAYYLNLAAQKPEHLGRYFSKYGVSLIISLAITDEVAAHVQPDLKGVLLSLVEIYQQQERWQDAISCLEKLQQLEPDDVVVKLSLAELLLTAYPEDRDVCHRVVDLTKGIANDTPVHTALLLYKARALRRLGLFDAALETLTLALRRKKGRSDELLRALRYERALVYEQLGLERRARSEFEKLYAEDPNYEDVAVRLGLQQEH